MGTFLNVPIFSLDAPDFVQFDIPPHSIVSSSGAKPSGHLSKQRPLCR